jgi:hypothetical protein
LDDKLLGEALGDVRPRAQLVAVEDFDVVAGHLGAVVLEKDFDRPLELHAPLRVVAGERRKHADLDRPRFGVRSREKRRSSQRQRQAAHDHCHGKFSLEVSANVLAWPHCGDRSKQRQRTFAPP